MPQTKPMVSIENVVASATVDQKIDLVDITKKFPDTEYHPLRSFSTTVFTAFLAISSDFAPVQTILPVLKMSVAVFGDFILKTKPGN